MHTDVLGVPLCKNMVEFTQTAPNQFKPIETLCV